MTQRDRDLYERVALALSNGKGHVESCPAKGKEPGAACSNSCAVYRCVYYSLKGKYEALDKRNAGD